MQLQTHFYLQNQPHRLDHVRTASRLFQCDYHYTLDKKLNNQMLHKKLVCCNVFLHLSFVQPNCSEIKKISTERKFHIYYNACFVQKTPHAHPPYSKPPSVNRVKYSLWLGNGLWEQGDWMFPWRWAEYRCRGNEEGVSGECCVCVWMLRVLRWIK